MRNEWRPTETPRTETIRHCADPDRAVLQERTEARDANPFRDQWMNEAGRYATYGSAR